MGGEGRACLTGGLRQVGVHVRGAIQDAGERGSSLEGFVFWFLIFLFGFGQEYKSQEWRSGHRVRCRALAVNTRALAFSLLGEGLVAGGIFNLFSPFVLLGVWICGQVGGSEVFAQVGAR